MDKAQIKLSGKSSWWISAGCVLIEDLLTDTEFCSVVLSVTGRLGFGCGIKLVLSILSLRKLKFVEVVATNLSFKVGWYSVSPSSLIQ